jgi:CubicO group peptidase (beta-lactamase class C family)
MIKAILDKKAPRFTGKGIGLVVGAIDKGRTITYSFGGVRDDNSAAPDDRTLYEIGSISKTFTSALLAVFAVNEIVSLEQPVFELLPELPGLPASITLQSLATHTSGLPRLPGNIWRSIRQNRENPYVNYTEADLLEYLRAVSAEELKTSAGLVRYSNLGMGVLGYALSKHSGMSYEQAVQHWVCRPLGLQDTSISLSADQEHRLAQAHNGAGKATGNFDLPSLPGAGALRSNMQDMQRYLRAYIKPAGTVHEALQLTLQVRHTEFARATGMLRLAARFRSLFPQHSRRSPKPLGIGLGWMRYRLPQSGVGAWLHNGGTTGYRCFVAFVPESETGVVVLNNQGFSLLDVILPRYTVDDLGIGLLDAMNR